MRLNIHLRFAFYALFMAAFFGITLFVLFSAKSDSFMPVLLLLLYLSVSDVRKFLGLYDHVSAFESRHSVSDRALLLGFLAFLAAFWVGALYFAFHFDPARDYRPLACIIFAVAWLISLYPAYRRWREQGKLTLA